MSPYQTSQMFVGRIGERTRAWYKWNFSSHLIAQHGGGCPGLGKARRRDLRVQLVHQQVAGDVVLDTGQQGPRNAEYRRRDARAGA